MIVDILKQYLSSYEPLTQLLSADRIYSGIAPSNVMMPWLVIEMVGGQRDKITTYKVEQEASCLISVYVGLDKKNLGYTIAEKALAGLDYFRGVLYNTNDVYIECTPIRYAVLLNGVYKYSFTARVRFIE